MFKRILTLGVNNQLAELLEAGFSEPEAQRILASGYEVVNASGNAVILDHAYGRNLPYSLYPMQTAHSIFTNLQMIPVRTDLRRARRPPGHDATPLPYPPGSDWRTEACRRSSDVGSRSSARAGPVER